MVRKVVPGELALLYQMGEIGSQKREGSEGCAKDKAECVIEDSTFQT